MKRYVVKLKLKDTVTGQQILDEINNIEELRNNDSCITSDFEVNGEMVKQGVLSVKRTDSETFSIYVQNVYKNLLLVRLKGNLIERKWAQQLTSFITTILDPTEPLFFKSYDYEFLENLIEATVGPYTSSPNWNNHRN